MKIFGFIILLLLIIGAVSMPYSVFLIINASFLFILGALIGWIVGKKKVAK